MVRNSFKVAYHFEERSCLLTFLITHFLRAQINKISADFVFVSVTLCLVFSYTLGLCLGIISNTSYAFFNCTLGAICHFCCNAVTLLECKSRCCKKSRIKNFNFFRFFIIFDEFKCKFFEKFCVWHKKRNTQNIEYCMNYGNAESGCRGV